HEVVITVRGGGRVWAPRAEDLLAIAIEDAQLHPAGLRETLEHRELTTTIGRPVLGDHEDLRGSAGLGGEPLDCRRLMIAQPGACVALAEHGAVVLAGRAARTGVREIAAEGFSRQILRAARVPYVLV